jgi:hypothetical protein
VGDILENFPARFKFKQENKEILEPLIDLSTPPSECNPPPVQSYS